MDSILSNEQKPAGNIPAPTSAGVHKAVGSGSLGRRQINFTRLAVIVGSVLLALVLLFWVGLQIYQRSLNGKITDIKGQIANIFSQSERAEALNIINTQSRAVMLQDILNSHIYSSKILSSIAAATLPKVRWSSYNLSVKDQTVVLKGQAASYVAVAQQLQAFAAAKFSNVETAGITLNKSGNLDFSVNFKFDPKILQNQ